MWHSKQESNIIYRTSVKDRGHTCYIARSKTCLHSEHAAGDRTRLVCAKYQIRKLVSLQMTQHDKQKLVLAGLIPKSAWSRIDPQVSLVLDRSPSEPGPG